MQKRTHCSSDGKSLTSAIRNHLEYWNTVDWDKILTPISQSSVGAVSMARRRLPARAGPDGSCNSDCDIRSDDDANWKPVSSSGAVSQTRAAILRGCFSNHRGGRGCECS